MNIGDELITIIHLNDYVSLEGVGSFTKKIIIAPADAALLPKGLQIGFREDRRFNDQAITRYIEKHLGYAEQHAETLAKQWVNDVTKKLSQNVQVTFPGVGTLSRQPEGQVLLQSPNAKAQPSPLYKLPVAKPATIATHSKRGRRRPLKRMAIAAGVTILAISGPWLLGWYLYHPYFQKLNAYLNISVAPLPFGPGAEKPNSALALLTPRSSESSPVNSTETNENTPDNSTPSDSSAKEPSSQPATLPHPHEQLTPSSAITPTNPGPDNQNSPESTIALHSEALDRRANQREALSYKPVQENDGYVYHLIAGSFTEITNANKLITELKAYGYPAELKQSGAVFRVSMGTFSSHSRAINERARIQDRHPELDIWVLKEPK